MSRLAVNILVVGPEAGAAAELSQAVAAFGHQITGTADNGREALQLLDRQPFDLAFVNLHLPGALDGLAAAEELHRRAIPVIYVAAYDDADLRRSPRWGVPCGYLIEPFDRAVLQVSISTALRQKELLEEAFAARSLVRTVLNQVHDGIIVTDVFGQVLSMSTAAEKVTGWASTEATGKLAEQICPLKEMNGRLLEQHPLRRVLEGNRPARIGRFALADRNGHEIPVEVYAASLCDASERMIGAVAVFWDVAERMRLEQSQTGERARQAGKIAAAESSGTTRTELLALIRRAITAQEDERRRLARELHDDLGQRIAFLQFEAERMRRFAHVPEVRAGLKRFIEEAERFSSDLRTLSHRLHPSILEDLGLGAALRSLAADYRRQGVDVTLRVGAMSGRASLDVRTSLYRITQEALRNAWKHAPGAAVHVQLLEENEQLQLTIEDTGPGFDVSLTRATGSLGLLSMQERARLAGGSFVLASHPDTGTTLVVRVPVGVTS